MKIYFVGEKQSFKNKAIVKKSIMRTVERLGQPKNISVCVNFVEDEEIRELNKQMRGVDKVTDVLSFPTFIPPTLSLKAEPSSVFIHSIPSSYLTTPTIPTLGLTTVKRSLRRVFLQLSRQNLPLLALPLTTVRSSPITSCSICFRMQAT